MNYLRCSIDLTVVNCVHMAKPHGDPTAEALAIDRIYRIGQQRDMDVVKYTVNGSIEIVSTMESAVSLKHLG
jgi:SNF2 family DNA or RNA helicase